MNILLYTAMNLLLGFSSVLQTLEIVISFFKIQRSVDIVICTLVNRKI